MIAAFQRSKEEEGGGGGGGGVKRVPKRVAETCTKKTGRFLNSVAAVHGSQTFGNFAPNVY